MLAYVVQNVFSALEIPMPLPPFEDLVIDHSSSFTDSMLDMKFGTSTEEMIDVSEIVIFIITVGS